MRVEIDLQGSETANGGRKPLITVTGTPEELEVLGSELLYTAEPGHSDHWLDFDDVGFRIIAAEEEK